MVTPFEASTDVHTNTLYSCNGLMTSLDNRPLGFPFDRKIDNFGRFYTPNMYFKNVAIFHKDATTDAHAYTQAIFNKNVNGFDNVFQTGPQYTPSHKLINENIYQQDDEVRSFQ